jgi:hypothetical protein
MGTACAIALVLLVITNVFVLALKVALRRTAAL